jgi:hypothetical protein
MAKVVLFASVSSLTLGTLMLAACARPAPEIPSPGQVNLITSSSRYAGAGCQAIVNRLAALDGEKRQLEMVIAGNRQHNQVAGYFGALFLLPALAAEHNPVEKARLDEIQQEQDELRAVAAKAECLY